MKEWIKGMDVSSLLEVERCGGKFYDHGTPGDAMAILKSYGANLIRLRLWNDPFDENGISFGGGGNDIRTTLALAKRAGEQELRWLLDFHYSDFWTDPGKQTLPRAWKGMDEAALCQAVYDYTVSVLKRCREEQVLPAMVSVGNEISNGLLWPVGKVPAYEQIARLVSAGIRGVRDAAPETPVMLHLDQGGDNELYRSWFDHYLEQKGEDFEYIGLSYYPFWHGTLPMLRRNMDDLAQRYQKDLILTEVSTAHTLEDYQGYEKLPADRRKGMAANAELAKKVPFPMTPEGQADFMKAVMEILRQVPGGRGRGFCYWEPAWIPVPGSGWAAEQAIAYMGERGPGGNEWANQALFDYDGNALPALEAIRDFQI